MAQKRNPVSLRLQTRLQGNEKRFASCWFTDCFFSQVYTNDLARRLYLGHLLHKTGSWSGERSESYIPETCVSIQFLYRRCSMLSIVLDKRKEEYLLSASFKGGNTRRESISPSFSKETKSCSFPWEKGLRVAVETKVENSSYHLNGKDVLFSTQVTRANQTVSKKDTALNLSKEAYNTALFLPGAEKDVLFSEKANYLSIANLFGSKKAGYKRRVSRDASLRNKIETPLIDTFSDSEKPVCLAKMGKPTYQREWKNWLYGAASLQYNVIPDSASVHTIESVCDLSEKKQERRGKNEYESKTEFCVPLFTPASYWSSYTLIRGTSASQNVEFCLYSIKVLYKKRFSFLQIKDTLFRMLSTNEAVRGARLTCSGRQGGRSKSAMRAKKQSALWGQTALSLFSSRLAFASTNVDTSFGQTGIKVWICYK